MALSYRKKLLASLRGIHSRNNGDFIASFAQNKKQEDM